eukprot:scaffold11336_cov32-Cyclotella_meneghiniana.AAC.2
MSEEGDKNPDPRNKIFDNMNDILDEWMGKGFHPMVMIDSNSEINERNLNENSPNETAYMTLSRQVET